MRKATERPGGGAASHLGFARLRASLAGMLIAGSSLVAAEARAGGPLLVNGAGQPLTWAADPVPYHPDRGMLGALTNAAATAHLASSAGAWTAVPTARVTLAGGSALPVDVTVANYPTYLGTCNDGLDPIVFDADGSITDDLLGLGANVHVIGFASPACGTMVPPVITKGFAVLNGKFLDGVDTSSNPELTPAEFDAVLIHELGHYLGLDHSQVNLLEAADGNPANDDAIATMFPVLINATEAASLHLDDVAAISALYPEPSFFSDFGTITGSIVLATGPAPFQGAHVIARAVGDPRRTAVAGVSGARFFPQNAGGPPDPTLRGHYEIPGLPAGTYTVEIEPIYAGFRGGSSVGPLDPPVPLPGPPEFWNGADEAGTNPPDDPSVAAPLAITAGTTVGDVDLIINHNPPPPNDECAGATDVTAIPFVETIDVTGATQGAFDPVQSCTSSAPQQNSNSVWYRFTPAVDGVLDVATSGSTYDTLVTISTGACGSLVEAGCDDDGGPSLQSSLELAVRAGTAYLIDVTSSQSGGGTLHLTVDFTPAASCAPTPITGCRAPASPGESLLRLKQKVDPARRQLLWKWVPGAATLSTDFGAPLDATGTSYALCVYDGTGSLVSSARVPAADGCGSGLVHPCWRETGTGFAYKDRELLPDGIKALTLKSGAAGQAKITAKGAGGTLAIPTLPLAFPVVAQLVNSDGICWEATYPATGILRNDADQLKAKGG